jgi:DNA-binding transcriptional regulator YiaG
MSVATKAKKLELTSEEIEFVRLSGKINKRKLNRYLQKMSETVKNQELGVFYQAEAP